MQYRAGSAVPAGITSLETEYRLHKQMHMCSAPCQVCSHSLCPSFRLVSVVSAISLCGSKRWASEQTRGHEQTHAGATPNLPSDQPCWAEQPLTIMCTSRTGSPCPGPLSCWLLLFFSYMPVISQLPGSDTLPSAQRSHLHESWENLRVLECGFGTHTPFWKIWVPD